MRFRTVIFDLDDTLYPEWDFIRSGFRAVEQHLTSLGVNCCGISERWYSIRRAGEPRVFDRWLNSAEPSARQAWQHFGSSQHAVNALVDLYRTHEPIIDPHPGVIDLLAKLRWSQNGHVKLGLLSDGYLRTQRAKLTALRLTNFFDAIVFSDELGREHWKPSPTPFFEVLERLGSTGDDAVYVGDNPTKDFLGARRAGLSSARLRLPTGVYSGLDPDDESHRPDFEFDYLESLGDWLTHPD